MARSRPLSRRAGTATEAETIIIVCEGEKTEDIYFNGVRREYRLATARIKFIGLGAVWPHRETAFANADQLDRQKCQDYPSMVDRNPWTSMQGLVRQLLVITDAPPPEGSAASSARTSGHRRGGR